MPDLSDFFPVFARTEEDIRADFDVRANAGLTTTDPNWTDTRQGSGYFLATQPSVIEFASAYDRMNEILAAAIIATSWGEFLDLHAASYSEERVGAFRATGVVRFTGDDGSLIGTGVRVQQPQTDPEIEPPIFETTSSGTIVGGFIDLAVQALQEGEDGNVPANTVTLLQTGVEGITAVNNPAPFSGGADVESDESLKTRLEKLFGGGGNATRSAYEREALRQPGVGFAFIERAWAGPGTVRIIARDDTGAPLSPTRITELQEYFDPNPGQGDGWAPINHEVTVATPTLVPVYTAATVDYEPGYSETGLNGTVALAQPITRRVQDYLNSLDPGKDVVYNHVLAQFFKVRGVREVTNLKIDIVDPPTGTTDIAIAATDIARAGTVALS